MDSVTAKNSAARIASNIERRQVAYRRHQLVVATGLSLRTIDYLLATGALPSVRVGGCRIVTARQLEQFFADLETSQSSQPGKTSQKSGGRKAKGGE